MDEKTIIFTILGITLFLFIYGRWRYDVVAVIALLASTIAGVVPVEKAFLGFGHPAVITVAAVFALSTALQNVGIVSLMYEYISKAGKNYVSQLLVLNTLIAIISGFMNNIGALSLLLPVVMQIAKKSKKSPSSYLMPVAFSALLGGMITMIGTPPNIIVALMRSNTIGKPFSMFDFTPVGALIAIGGVLFLTFFGVYLIPKRKGKTLQEELFEVEDYLTELKVGKNSTLNGMTVKECESLTEGEITVLSIVRGKKRLTLPRNGEDIKGGDILLVQTDSETLKELIETTKAKIVGDKKHKKELLEEVSLSEVVVKTDSPILRKSINELNLRARFKINLLAVSRAGTKILQRLKSIRIQAGDVLLLRGPEQTIADALPLLGCLPLQYRALKIGEAKSMILGVGIFAAAICTIATGVLPIQIAFLLALVLMHLLGLVRLKEIYQSVDWSIIVLLGALIPVGHALETTGGAQLIAEGIMEVSGGMSPVVILTAVLVGTMFLSDIVNNASAVILMFPIALKIAEDLGVSPDPFFMAVAIGGSCPFLTPIGHQCNAIIMGPGGYAFGDYWKLGLLLEVIIVIIAIPSLLFFWPL